jgi:hypothetical protein
MIPAILGGLALAAPVANLIGKMVQPSQPQAPVAPSKSFETQLHQASIKKLTGAELAARLSALDFNGKQALAVQLPNKSIELEDSAGRKVAGSVESVRFEGQELLVKVNGKEFGVNSIRNVFGV